MQSPCSDITNSDESENDLVLQEAYIILKRISYNLCNVTTKGVVKQLKNLPIFTFHRMREVADIIYEQVSHKPQKADFFAEICHSFKDIKITKMEEGIGKTVTFCDLLIASILDDIQKRATYKVLLNNVIQNCKATEERKQNWLKYQNGQLKSNLTKTACGSVKFIEALNNKGICPSDKIFKIIKAVQQIPGNESAEYLNILLTTCGKVIERKLVVELKSDKKVRKCFQEMYIFIQRNSLIPINENTKLKNLIRLQVNHWEVSNLTIPLTFKSINVNNNLNTNFKNDPDFYRDLQDILMLKKPFSNISKKFKSLPINTKKRLDGAVNLIYEKAVCAPNATKICVDIIKSCSKLTIVKGKNDNEADVSFRYTLIKKLQKEFEFGNTDMWREKIDRSTDAENTIILQLALEEERVKLRERLIGNCRLIAELYKVGFIPLQIICICIESLLNDPDDMSLERLCVLLLTIGTYLKFNSNYNKLIQSYYQRMCEIEEKLEESPKVQALLHRVIINWKI